MKKPVKKPKQADTQRVGRKFTNRQQRFIDAYAGNCKEAARKAKISYGYARQLLTKSNILEAIRTRQDTEVRPKTILTRQQRQEFWSKVMDDENENMHNRLRASELLGKSEADFVEHLVVKEEDTLTDEECEEIREILRKNLER
jgi:phage terminase small subunit